jgi:hypothetical protein
MRVALRLYQRQQKQGNTKELKDYAGYSQPYNYAFMAMVHKFFPFNFCIQQASQASRRIDDLVLHHPLTIAGGELPEDQKYFSKSLHH